VRNAQLRIDGSFRGNGLDNVAAGVDDIASASLVPKVNDRFPVADLGCLREGHDQLSSPDAMPGTGGRRYSFHQICAATATRSTQRRKGTRIAAGQRSLQGGDEVTREGACTSRVTRRGG